MEPAGRFGTTHVSVVDKDRNAVASTSTINTEFGSKLVSPSTGIVLNNEMDDFSSPGEVNHYMAWRPTRPTSLPRKRPPSSMSPTIVTLRRKWQAVRCGGRIGRTQDHHRHGAAAVKLHRAGHVAAGRGERPEASSPAGASRRMSRENQRCLGTGPERKLEADVEALSRGTRWSTRTRRRRRHSLWW